MRRTFLGVAITGSLVLGLLQFAGADTKSITDSDTDASSNSFDVVSANATHNDDGKLQHTVKFDAPIDGTGDGQILLQFNLDEDRACEREFIWPPAGSSPVIRCGVGPTDKNGNITQVAPNKLRFVFRKGAILSPDKYGWRVITKECPGLCDTIDAAPDQDGDKQVYVRHNLP